MLETYSFVRCLLADFFEAFDTIDYAIVLREVNVLSIPRSIKKSVVNFLISRA